MKTTLKAIAIMLAISASAQTIKSYADDVASLPELISEQEAVLVNLLYNSKAEIREENEPQVILTEEEKKELIIKNMIHYIRLIEGKEIMLEELQRQQFPDLDIRGILEGRQNPGI
ncbi:hypothetical protein [Halobacteriovorax sp. HLS]|uniref:hypothetical protein n=1 Tax=Halobacteriovorax sp. HLS TaxID=2234000 RepID=UPI000FDC3D46|nr:hypothetical protein [Halobacteriovorax sp. HLS]